jgi:hypothetical protein
MLAEGWRVVLMDAAGVLHLLRSDGRQEKSVRLSSVHAHWQEDFFVRNRAYCLATWRPQGSSDPWVIMGHHASVGFLRPDGIADTYPNPNDNSVLAEQQGYLWRGLIYYERCLPESVDLTGDGVDDQVFLSRGWATKPTIAFMDGAKRDFYKEHLIPNSQPLALQLVRDAEGRPAIFAASEQMAGLFEAATGKELWQVRFDSPAAAATAWPGDELGDGGDGPTFVIAKRDGILLALNAVGEPRWQRVLSSGPTALCCSGGRLFVGQESGALCYDGEGTPVAQWDESVTHLVPFDDATVIGATTSPVRIVKLQAPEE